jgi:hypothetical protein
MKILISADGARMTMRKKAWAMTCPTADLPKWVAFYQQMVDRNGGRFAIHYREDLADLHKAQQRLKARAA